MRSTRHFAFLGAAMALGAVLLAVAQLTGCYNLSKSSFADADTDTGTEEDGGDEPEPGSELEWVIQAGGKSPYAESGMGIDTFVDGSFLVTGMYTDGAIFGAGDEGETVLQASGCHDMFIALYDRDGVIIDAMRIGGEIDDESNHTEGRGLQILDDGSFVVTGAFYGTDTIFGAGEDEVALTPTSGSWDLFVARFNSDWTLDWVRQAGGSSKETAAGYWISDDESTLWLVGTFSLDATFGPGEAQEVELSTDAYCYDAYPGTTMFLAAFDLEDGHLLWAKQAQGCSEGREVSGANDTGYLMVTGRFEEAVTLGDGESVTSLESAGGDAPDGDDIFVARYRAEDGVLDWAVSAGGTDRDWGTAIAEIQGGAALVAGSFEGSATFTDVNGEDHETVSAEGEQGIFRAVYSSSGDLVSVSGMDVNTGNCGVRLHLLDEGDYVLAGHFRDTAVFGLGEANEISFETDNDDIFLAKYDSSGDLVWARHEHGVVDGHDGVSGMAVPMNGFLLATGMFQGSVVFGQGEENETTLTAANDGSTIGIDVYVMKLAIE